MLVWPDTRIHRSTEMSRYILSELEIWLAIHMAQCNTLACTWTTFLASYKYTVMFALHATCVFIALQAQPTCCVHNALLWDREDLRRDHGNLDRETILL